MKRQIKTRLDIYNLRRERYGLLRENILFNRKIRSTIERIPLDYSLFSELIGYLSKEKNPRPFNIFINLVEHMDIFLGYLP